VNQTIGEFLRSRRARIQPRDVGLPDHGRRRVAGLRREELAQLAGVSVDYYIRLEQGRSPSVSDAVLDAIARVLRLDETERTHLRNLVRPRKGGHRTAKVRPDILRLLELIPGVPAFVLGRRMDVLAWNALADAISGFSTQDQPTPPATPSCTRPPASSTPSGRPSPQRPSPTWAWTPAATRTTRSWPRWSASCP
jgi:transcriptional regulator with XRE-family HTH domain